MNKWLRLVLVFVFSINTSCASKPIREYKSITLENVDARNLPLKFVKNIQYSDLIYTASKLPLEDFFNGVMTGQFTNALKNLDVLYHPSNTDNEVLLKLVSNGVVPVFVSIQNKGGTPLRVESANFVLTDRNMSFFAIKKSDIPDRISRFSTKNAAINVINVGAVVVLMAAVLAAAVAARANLPGNIDPFFNGSGPGSNELYELKGTTIITKIDYGNLIFESTVLQPGETVKGLLFFQTKNQKPPVKPILQLVF